ncbi:MAG TPA: hypothetical protein VG326_05585 [Tepidisphaeraceae bacterium]|jgi:hypothetical protein|nr:hypothetical protein [Tepidisphaeraceae bacterium]
MNSTWPKEVADFEAFLTNAGLVCQRREEQAAFGNKVLQYGNASIAVRLVSDRGVWYVEVADAAGRPTDWYDAAILRDLLNGRGDDVLPLRNQIETVEINWPQIVSGFDPAQSKNTHARLALLRRERAQRRFPGVY